MIQSLEDAWECYIAVKSLARDMTRLAGKWNDPDLERVLGRDNHLRGRTTAELEQRSALILEDLDDRAVLVMFSVIEASVRGRVIGALNGAGDGRTNSSITPLWKMICGPKPPNKMQLCSRIN